MANLANMTGMTKLRDEKGNLISDDEFVKNIEAKSIEKGIMSPDFETLYIKNPLL